MRLNRELEWSNQDDKCKVPMGKLSAPFATNVLIVRAHVILLSFIFSDPGRHLYWHLNAWTMTAKLVLTAVRGHECCIELILVLGSWFLLRKISRSSGCLPICFRIPWLLFHTERTFLSSPPASPLPSPSRNQCRAERRNKTAI